MGLLAFAGAGALAGGGAGLASQSVRAAKKKQELARDRRREKSNLELEDVRNTNQRGLVELRGGLNDERQKRLIKSRDDRTAAELKHRATQGQLNRGVELVKEEGRNVRDTSATGNKNKGAREVRDWKIIKSRNITKDENGKDVLNVRAANAQMRDRGYSQTKYPDTPNPISADRMAVIDAAAIRQAKAERDDLDGVLGIGGDKFKKDGGSASRFQSRRKREIKAQMVSDEQNGGPSTAKKPVPNEAKPPAGKPRTSKRGIEIQGTPAQQKAQMEKIPVGGVAIIKGKLYIKNKFRRFDDFVK